MSSDHVEPKTIETTAPFALVVHGAIADRKFRVRVIGTGFGANFENGAQWFVPDTDAGIGSARKTFGGARVHWHKVGEKFDHVDKQLADWIGTNHDIGYLSDLSVVEGGLEATLNVDDDVPPEIADVIASRKVGLSIEAYADRQPAIEGGKKVVHLVNFRHGPQPASVALVSDPALRGEILRVAASRLKAQEIADMAEANKDAPVVPDVSAELAAIKAAKDSAENAATEIAKTMHELRVTNATATLDAAILASQLPEKARTLVRAAVISYAEKGEAVPADVLTKHIDAARDLIKADAKVNAGGDVQVGMTERDRMTLVLDRMILGNQFDERAARVDRQLAKVHGGKTLAEREAAAGIPVAPFMGPRRALTIITGVDPADWRSGGYMNRAASIRASVGVTAMADLWADRMHKMTLAYYETSDYRSNIRKMAKVISVSDFRNVDFVALGGYGNLAAVAKGADYAALSTPSSQGHEFTISKYGGTETIAWEDIVNDDMQVVQQTPRRLEDAYTRTLFEAVADKYLIANLTTDTTDYDSTAWCTTSRTPDNFNTTAFSATELAAVVKLMYQATDFSNGKRLALRPKYLLHPIDLELTVRDTLIATPAERPGITTDYSYAQSLGIEPILIPGWTNAKDHVYLADPNGPAPPQVLAFLNGQEAPTIDVQDMRTVGSWFDKDTLTMKISGVWGNDLVRHEGIFAEDVA